ncbi:chromosome partitioning protein ParA [Lacinutrix sp. MedPE-SW]|uniref:chromosome partitioning protein ParA n=1 Tax=Lacinutrix sp. MedPE-SW TaxID=1860087 RepID=UPI000914CDA4|nr:chromosome partitioning protein ParA [Lacinutrix sp. MedPE-SW]OIQ23975.1 MAG: chromosome partitioning protein ParA [Lacinutrix sp. MedPE-SW]
MANSGNTGLKVALGIAIALFIGVGVFSSSLYKEKQENEKVLAQEKNKVIKELNEMANRYDVAMSENTVANQNLVEAKERIEGLIDSLKVSETNLKSLWKYKNKYLALQDEMTVILTENDKLKVENQLLATASDSLKIQLEERTTFTDSLLVQNTALADVVESAAVLTANSMKVNGVIERSSGKQIPTERARRSDKIRVCFTVAKNRLVEAGDKELFVQVIDPKNNILGLNSQVNFGEESLNYSLISKFNYENNSIDICEFIAKTDEDTDFESGVYKVNVFNGKELVANSQFSLK